MWGLEEVEIGVTDLTTVPRRANADGWVDRMVLVVAVAVVQVPELRSVEGVERRKMR